MECAFLWDAKAVLVDGGSLLSLVGDINDRPRFLAPFSVGLAAAGSVSFMGIFRLDTECGDLAVEPLSRSSDLKSGSSRRAIFRFFLPCFPPLTHMLDHNKKGRHE